MIQNYNVDQENNETPSAIRRFLNNFRRIPSDPTINYIEIHRYERCKHRIRMLCIGCSGIISLIFVPIGVVSSILYLNGNLVMVNN